MPAKWIASCGALLLSLLPDAAGAQLSTETLKLDKLDVEVLGHYPRGPIDLGAWSSYGLTVHNRGPDTRLHVELDGQTHLQRVVRLPAGETRRMFFHLPTRQRWTHATVAVTDMRTGDRRGTTLGVLYEAGEPIARIGAIHGAFNVSDPWKLVGALDTHMPSDFRGLVGFSAVVVEEHNLQRALQAHVALRDWLAIGGRLVVASGPETVEALRAGRPGAAVIGEALPFSGPLQFGAEPVSAHALRLSATAAPPSDEASGADPFAPQVAEPAPEPPFAPTTENPVLAVRPVGAGSIVFVPAAALSSVDADFHYYLSGTTPHRFETPEAGALFSLMNARLGDAGLSSGTGLFIALLCFALCVGPIAWRWMVVRRGRPLAYVAIVMAGAFVFSIAVVVADALAIGVDPYGAGSSLWVVDQRSDRALRLEAAAVYPTSGRGSTLRLQPGGGVMLPPAHDPTWFDEDPDLERFRWTQDGDGVALHDALRLRQRQLAAVTRFAPASGKLSVRAVDGGIDVENHFAHPIADLHVVQDGQHYSAEQLGSGERKRLSPTDARAPRMAPDTLAAMICGGLHAGIVDGVLGPNRYVARVLRPAGEVSFLDVPLVETAPGAHHVAGVLP